MSPHKNFLDDEIVLTIRPQFAAFLGLNESIVVQQLHYWLKKAEKGQCGRFIEGYYWVWNSLHDWLEQFPFFSDSTLKRIFSNLKKDGIIHIEQFDGSNRTNFYRIDYENLDKLLENAQKSQEVKMTSCGKTPSGQNDPLKKVNLNSSSVQIDLKYITEIPSEISPEISFRGDNARTRESSVTSNSSTDKKIQHLTTIYSTTPLMIEMYLDFRMSSGGIENPDAFESSIWRNLLNQASAESEKFEEWIFTMEKYHNVVAHLIREFLSFPSHFFSRKTCFERAKDDFTLMQNNIKPTNMIIEIAFQKAEAQRRERIGAA